MATETRTVVYGIDRPGRQDGAKHKLARVVLMFADITSLPFLRGMIMGVLMAAPIGAVGLMCVKRAISGQWLRALAVGMGSATVDAAFGAVAALGLTIVATFLVAHQTELGLVGGLIVMGLGIATYFAKVEDDMNLAKAERVPRDFAKAFTLSLANPATFLGALGLFAALGPVDGSLERTTGLLLVAGVFCGSVTWWISLSAAARVFRKSFQPQTLARFNKIEGAVIVMLGLIVMAVSVSNL
jgi:threonine/homoserine/homoserine lactone efflux protein